MPGQPSRFTNKTIIFCHGQSGCGKTTLCSFISDDNIYHFSTDKLYSRHTLKKIKSKPNKFYDFIIDTEKKRKIKPYTIIGQLCHITDTTYYMEYCDYVCEHIKHIFDNHPTVMLILVEGYQLHCENILNELVKRLNSSYMCWNITRG